MSDEPKWGPGVVRDLVYLRSIGALLATESCGKACGCETVAVRLHGYRLDETELVRAVDLPAGSTVQDVLAVAYGRLAARLRARHEDGS